MGSVLVQVGPAEPWTGWLRLSVTQQLARRWIGGEIRVATDPGHEAEGLWFAEGVSRYVALADLSRLGLMTPEDVRSAVSGELSVLATSPERALPNARLAELAATGDEVARATIMARGALYALREAAVMRAHTKGARGLDAVLALLVKQAEEHKQGAFAVSAWLDAIGKDDPNAARIFDAYVVKGDAITLPADALGPCFRAGTGDYVAFDPGFDLPATQASKDGKVVGVRPDGPAAKAGLKDGDIVQSMQAREGDGSSPVKITVKRYVPRGARGRGQTWTRVPGVSDDRCGTVP
jgi:predicted metalloprotease with PDZ domain